MKFLIGILIFSSASLASDGTVTVAPDGTINISFPQLDQLAQYVDDIETFLKDGKSSNLGEEEAAAESDIYNIDINQESLKEEKPIKVTLGSEQKIKVRVQERISEEVRAIIEFDGVKSKIQIDDNSLKMITQNPLAQKLSIQNGLLVLNDGFMDHTLPATFLKDSADEELNDCYASIQMSLNNPAYGQKLLAEFLSLQKDITLYKIAHAYLSLKNEKESLETTLNRLMKEKDSLKFEKVRSQFQKLENSDQSLFLLLALNDVKEIISKQSQSESKFNIAQDDLKLLAILKAQGQSPEFIKIVNKTYKDDLGPSLSKNALNQKLTKAKKSLEKLIKKLVYNSCFETQGKSCKESISEINSFYSKEIDQLTSVIIEALLKK